MYIVDLTAGRFLLNFPLLQAFLSRLKTTSLFIAMLFVVQGVVGQLHAAEREVPEGGIALTVPAKPAWDVMVESRKRTAAVTLTTPAEYYPLMTIEIIRVPDFKVTEAELGEVALSTLNTYIEGLGLRKVKSVKQLQKARYGNIEGFGKTLTLRAEGESWSAKAFMGILPSGYPLTFFAVTGAGQIKQVEDKLEAIVGSVREL